MDESLAPPVAPQRSLWLRFLLMLVMAFAFYVAGTLLGFIAILQLALSAFAGGPNPQLQSFGGSLGRYLAQLVRFVSFESDEAPFPFTDWPTAGS